MEWLQGMAAFIVALVAVARFFLDWRKSRQSKQKERR